MLSTNIGKPLHAPDGRPCMTPHEIFEYSMAGARIWLWNSDSGVWHMAMFMDRKRLLSHKLLIVYTRDSAEELSASVANEILETAGVPLI